MIDPGSVAWDARGLVPVVVQDPGTRRVLMVAYQNREALEQTLRTGTVHFWSRSREELWEKGGTSGNRLELASIEMDCDGDTLLVWAHPTGPVCHTGATTCFDPAPLSAGFGSLDDLWETVTSRARERPTDSYTVRLLDGAPDLPARKLVEEATEVLMAVKDHATGAADAARVAEEAADLLYHLLVVLLDRGVDPATVMQVLARRAR